jgi:hypothetical protein
MKPNAWILKVVGCLAIFTGYVFGLIPQQTMAQQPGNEPQETIAVHLASGRLLTAELDPRTDSSQLWLRWQCARAELLRPILWDCVISAEIKGHNISGEDLLELVRQIRRDLPAQSVSLPLAKSIVMLGSASAETAAITAPSPPTEKTKTPRVHWLKIDARPARWDNYVETDGMLICIAPLDASGEVVPVRGTLEVDLIAEHADVVRLAQPFSRIGHWSQAVRPEDFAPSGAVYRLRFQGMNPEFSSHLAPHGAVHACLSVPGQGSFEATEDTRIRPYSLIRDRLQQTTGQRFFAEETTGQPW